MLDIKQMQQMLQDRNLAEVARQIGVTRAYLSAFRRGLVPNPSLRMATKISNYLQGKHNESKEGDA